METVNHFYMQALIMTAGFVFQFFAVKAGLYQSKYAGTCVISKIVNLTQNFAIHISMVAPNVVNHVI